MVAFAAGRSAGELELEWHAPRSCPEDARLRRWIDDYREGTGSVAGVAVDATAARKRAGWVITLELAGAGTVKRRVLPPQSTCEGATRAGAFIIALALDPMVEAGQSAQTSARDLVMPPRPFAAPPLHDWVSQPEMTAEPIELPPRRAEPAPTKPLRGSVHGLVGVAWGAIPGVALLAGGGASLLWERVFVRGSVHATAPQRLWFDDLPPANVEFRHYAIGLGAGPRWTVHEHIDVELGLGFELGELRARPHELARAQAVRMPWAAWRLESGLNIVPARWLAFGVRARLLGPLIRPRYRLSGHTVHQPGLAALAGVFFLEGRFP